MRSMCLVLAWGLAAVQTAQCQTMKLLVWNVQNDGSNAEQIAQELGELHRDHQFELAGLSEVDAQQAIRYQQALTAAAGKEFQATVSRTGGGGDDFLVILYDTAVLSLQQTIELHEYGGHKLNFQNSTGQFRFRSPFAVRLRHRAHRTEFLLMVNHLVRGIPDNPLRDSQVKGLNAWARDQSLPIILGGDLNLDVDINTLQGNSSAALMFAEGSPWKWVKPVRLIDTNWADDPLQPGQQDRFPDSLLDFVFTAGPASDWSASSEIIVREGDFPDGEAGSDHRPVLATITLAAESAAGAPAEQLVAASRAGPASSTRPSAEGGPAIDAAEAKLRAAISELDRRISSLNARLADASPAAVAKLKRLLAAKLQLLTALEILAFELPD